MDQWEADDTRRRHMARFGRRDTAPELALRRELHRRGRRFFVDRQVSRRCRVRPDLVFPRARIAVFVDGCFWHHCEEHVHLPKANAELWRRKLLANRQRDARNQAILTSEGWRVIRSWEHDDPTAVADRVEDELDRWAVIVSRRRKSVGPAPERTGARRSAATRSVARGAPTEPAREDDASWHRASRPSSGCVWNPHSPGEHEAPPRPACLEPLVRL